MYIFIHTNEFSKIESFFIQYIIVSNYLIRIPRLYYTMDSFIYIFVILISLYSIVYSELPFITLFSNKIFTTDVSHDNTTPTNQIDPYYDLNLQIALQHVLHTFQQNPEPNIDLHALIGYANRLETRLDHLYEINESVNYDERILYEEKMNIIQHSNFRGSDLLHHNINETKELITIITNITKHYPIQM